MTDYGQPSRKSFDVDDGTRLLDEFTQLSDENILPSGADTLRASEALVEQPFQMTSPFVKPLHFIGDIDELDD